MFEHPLRPGTYWQYTAPAFGFAPAPAVLSVITRAAIALFCAALREIAAQLPQEEHALAAELRSIAVEQTRRYDERAFDAYADDFCASASPRALAILDFVMEMEGLEAGLPWDPKKDVFGPTIVVLGAMLSAPHQRLWLPPLRAKAYASVLSDFITEFRGATRVPWGRVASIRGKLGFAATLARMLRWALGSVDSAMYAQAEAVEWGGAPPEWAWPSARFWHELEQFWLPLLLAAAVACHPLLSRSRWSVLPRERATALATGRSGSDASGSTGMGGAVGSTVVQRPLTDSERAAAMALRPEGHIQVFEGRGAWEVLAHRLQLHIAADGTVHSGVDITGGQWLLEIDNAGAVSDWNRGGQAWSASDAMRGEFFAAILADVVYGVELRAYHLPGTIIIKLGHDDASREMRASGTALASCAVRHADDSNFTAGEFWRLVQHVISQMTPARTDGNDLILLSSGSEVFQYVVDDNVATVASRRARYVVDDTDGDSSGDEELCAEAWRMVHTELNQNHPLRASFIQTWSNRLAQIDDQSGATDSVAPAAAATEHAAPTEQPAATVPVPVTATAQPSRFRRQRQTPAVCSLESACICSSSQPALRCHSCPRSFHWRCLGIEGRSHSPVTWQCGVCACNGNAELAAAILMDRAMAFTATAPAPNSDKTYSDGVERFARAVELLAKNNGFTLSRADILPAAPTAETQAYFAIAFVHGVAGALEDMPTYAINTIKSTLASLRKWHVTKSQGEVQGPSKLPDVLAAITAAEKRLVAAGTPLVQRAFPCPLSVMEAIADEVSRQLCVSSPGHHTWNRRFAVSRAWLYRLLQFVCILRTNEGVTARFSPECFRPASGTDGDMLEFWVPPGAAVAIGGGKNHQTWGCWVKFPANGPGRLTMLADLARHEQLLVSNGVTITPDTPVFGMVHAPLTPLTSARAMFTPEFHRDCVVPALTSMGRTHDISQRWTPYSYRRGGINTLYQQARAAGFEPLDMLAMLMAAGRWRSLGSLLVYLVEIDQQLARHFKLLCASSGRTISHMPGHDSDDDTPSQPKPSKPSTSSAGTQDVRQLWAQLPTRLSHDNTSAFAQVGEPGERE